ncbi:hypothetical protein ACKWTF_014093 [Chironomus riparius]
MQNFYKLISSILVITFVCCASSSRVLELGDRFLDVRSEGMWFVKFYAPYCGFCKKLEPVWNLVAQTLYNTNIRVGKVDCTRFKSVCQSFDVQGYPTVIFVRGHNEYVFNGERSKDELVHFAMRMSGPPVQQVTRTESFEILKANNPIFFVYIGKQQGALWEFYYIASEANQQFAYFYATNNEIGSKHFMIDSHPVVLVYKENTHYIYPLSDAYDVVEPTALNDSMHNWIIQEKFATFPRVTRENLHQLRQTKKFLVIAVVEENKLSELETHEQEFRDMVEQIIRTKRSKYHANFQFGWTGTPDLAHTIAMEHLPTPHLLVLNSTTNHHHVPDDDPMVMTSEAIEMFLDSINNQTATVYGGDHYSVRLYRAFFETRRLLAEMWRGNPILCFVLFVVPFGFFMIILYSIFCADIMDAEDADDDHEKKE